MTQHVETLGTVVHAMCRHVRQYAAACKCEVLLMCFPRHRFIDGVASGRDFQIVCNATEQFKKLPVLDKGKSKQVFRLLKEAH